MAFGLDDLLGYFAGDSGGAPGDISSLAGDASSAADPLAAAGGAAADGGMDLGSVLGGLSQAAGGDPGVGADGLIPLTPADATTPYVYPQVADGGQTPNLDQMFRDPGYTPMTSGAAPSLDTFHKIVKGLGLDGDLSDPKTMQAWMRLISGGGMMLSKIMQGNRPLNQRTPGQLQASLPGATQYSALTPGQAAAAAPFLSGNAFSTPWNQRGRVYSASGPAPISKAQGGLVRYCDGGGVYK